MLVSLNDEVNTTCANAHSPGPKRGWPFQCWAYFYPKPKDAKIFENHLNPVILVFIWKLSLSSLIWVPICQGFSHFSGFLHHFVLAKLASSRRRVNLSFWAPVPISSMPLLGQCIPKWCIGLTLPMLRLLLSKAQDRKDFINLSKPCHVGIHWIALAEYSHMSTHLPGFHSFFRFLSINLYWPN